MTIEQRAEKAADAVEWSDLYAKRRETYKYLWLAGFRDALDEAAKCCEDRFIDSRWRADLESQAYMHATEIRALGAKQEEEK